MAFRGPGGQFMSAASIVEADSPYITLDTNARAVALRMELAALAVASAMTEALAEATLIIREGIRKNFESEGAYFGERWEELSDKTIANKEAKGTAENQILVDHGDLRHDLTDDYGMFIAAIGTEVKVGTDDWRAHFHQGGTEKMPARPIIGVAEHDVAEIYVLFESAVNAALLTEGL